MSELLSAPEVAARLGCHPSRVGQLIREGRLPALRVAGRWVVEAAALEGFRLSGQGWPKGKARKGQAVRDD